MTHQPDKENEEVGRALADAAVVAAAPTPANAATPAGAATPFAPSEADAAYMALAIEEARAAAAIGEVPIGAVVVYEPIDRGTRRPVAEPRVIARAHNLRETTRDPAGHAEFLAMKEAARALDAWRLSDCTVYVTLEPCIMCAGLMHQARIARCVYGAPDQKAGALGTLYAINSDERLNHQFAVTAGVMQDECAELLRRFFAERRKKK
ncbi:MAG: nucleoside deaminase [Eggerthellaceae bacterium]|nr:nucleoside deaminase [Eggerthellaceae bacterium]